MKGVSRRSRHRLLMAVSTSVLLVFSLVQCGDDDDDGCASGVPCVCSGARGCIYECPESGCIPQCDNVDFCSADCGGNCEYTCHNVHQCSVGCGSNCDVSCSGECEVRCADVPESSCVANCQSGAAPTACGNGVYVCDRSCPSGND